MKPADKSQGDIAREGQAALERQREERRQGKDRDPTVRPNDPGHRATRFDGNPNPTAAEDSGPLKPRDDTPAILEKRRGPVSPPPGKK